ncbi:MAG: polysaccharide deacetylase family protein [Pseudomonadota bacterium]|nr:polysaccharide deacetylase family protein [Pseudomonadota bacterium]
MWQFSRCASAVLLAISASLTFGAEHGVALLYHHIATHTPLSTSVSPQKFRAHLRYLKDHNFNVMKLSTLVETLRAGDPLPERSVALTFDDAYKSVHTTALPLVREWGYPITVFVNTDKPATQSHLYMNWEELADVISAGGEVHSHGHGHASLAFPEDGESMRQWRLRVQADIRRANNLIEQHLRIRPELFAYPYGEYSQALKDVLDEFALVGIGQHSGAIGFGSDFLGLPRHPLYHGADDLQHFAQRVRTRPLYLTASPEGPLRVDSNSSVTLTLRDSGVLPTGCFLNGTPIALHSTLDGTHRLQETGPFLQRRSKINCTKKDGKDHYLWWSYLFIRP